jgi:phospholipase C
MSPQGVPLNFLLEGNLEPAGTAADAGFGASVALSADGNTAVVGSMTDSAAGSASVFVRGIESNNVGTWTQQGDKLRPVNASGQAYFGASVAISFDGNVIVVGAFGDSGVGTAWVYKRVDQTWALQAKLSGAGAIGNAGFGWSVAISAYGDVILVGAKEDNARHGAAWVFMCPNADWNAPGWDTNGTKLLCADTGPQNFGIDVALSALGDVALIGASGVGSVSGAAWVYTATGSNGAQQWIPVGTKLAARNNPGSNFGFGTGVALSADGNVALVGSFGNGSDATQCGAWVYTRTNGVWNSANTKLVPSNLGSQSWFGGIVALSANGQMALISDLGNELVTAWVFNYSNGNWTQEPAPLSAGPTNKGYSAITGLALSPDGHTALLGGYGNAGDPQGAWVFDNDKKLISHVFVLMLENHSFDNIFAYSGIPGISTSAAGMSNTYTDATGTHVFAVSKGAPVNMPTDPGHEFSDAVEQICGIGKTFVNGQPYPQPIDNSGFAHNYATTRTEIKWPGNPRLPNLAEVGDIMKCFDTPAQLPVIFALATEYAICDQWFSSLPGPTFPNRAFVHGGSSSGLVHDPSGKWVLPGFGFTYTNGTIFQALTRNGINWKLYQDKNGSLLPPLVSMLQGIEVWNVSDFKNFAADVKDPAYPEGYTFIEPNYGSFLNGVITGSFKGGSSQHPMDGTYRGELLIKQTYEAIRSSPFWNTSLLIVTYDEHGGFFDSAKPGPAPIPGDGTAYADPNGIHFCFDQFGVRVPAVVVSPLIKKGTVASALYDHTSVLATLREIFGVPSLTNRDAKANSLHGILTHPAVLRPDSDCPHTLPDPIPDPPTPASFLSDSDTVEGDPGLQPLPESGIEQTFLATLLKANLALSDGSELEHAAILTEFEGLKTYADADAYIRKVNAKVEQARAGSRGTRHPL